MMAPRPAFCDGIVRRDFLRLGTAGIFGLGLTLPEILARRSLAAEQGRGLPAKPR